MKAFLKIVSMTLCTIMLCVLPLTWPIGIIVMLALCAGGWTPKELN